MGFDVSTIGAGISVAALLLCCSCEKHPVGELPPVQREHPELKNPSSSAAENTDEVRERPAEPEAAPNRTPAEFFPSATPH
jgi:hypothetical protein